MNGTQHVAVGAARVTVERGGSGQTIVFLHAGVGDRRMWRPQVEQLSSEFETIAYDRRGFGLTTTPDEPFSHVEDLCAILDSLDRQEVSLVGASQGARIAVDFALAHPSRVRRLALLSPAISGASWPESFPAEVRASLDELDLADEADDLERINRAEAHLWLDGPAAPEGRVGGPIRELFLDMNGIALRHPDLDHEREPASALDRIDSIDAPTLVVWGELDFPHVRERGAAIASSIGGAEAHEIPNAAHLLNLEHPGGVHEHLLRFLRA